MDNKNLYYRYIEMLSACTGFRPKELKQVWKKAKNRVFGPKNCSLIKVSFRFQILLETKFLAKKELQTNLTVSMRDIYNFWMHPSNASKKENTRKAAAFCIWRLLRGGVEAERPWWSLLLHLCLSLPPANNLITLHLPCTFLSVSRGIIKGKD